MQATHGAAPMTHAPQPAGGKPHPGGSVQAWTTLRSDLASFRELGLTWREIAAKYPGVPAGTLCAILKGRVPPEQYRKALGMVRPRKPTRAVSRRRLWRCEAWQALCARMRMR